MRKKPRFEEPATPMRIATASVCQEMADITNDGRWRAAARILLGRKSGRSQIDDTAALRYVAVMMATGAARSVHHACSIAAQMYAPQHQIETMRDRLRRKFRTQPIKSEDMNKDRA